MPGVERWTGPCVMEAWEGGKGENLSPSRPGLVDCGTPVGSARVELCRTGISQQFISKQAFIGQNRVVLGEGGTLGTHMGPTHVPSGSLSLGRGPFAPFAPPGLPCQRGADWTPAEPLLAADG
jgi:hypothetical protein